MSCRRRHWNTCPHSTEVRACPSVCLHSNSRLLSDRSLKRLRLFDLPAFEGKEVATMILEEQLPGCLVEGIDYETEAVAGLLTSGDTEEQSHNESLLIDKERNGDHPRPSVQVN